MTKQDLFKQAAKLSLQSLELSKKLNFQMYPNLEESQKLAWQYRQTLDALVHECKADISEISEGIRWEMAN